MKIKRVFNKLRVKNFCISLFKYTIMSAIGFIFLYPIFVLISGSAMDAKDLANPLVNWIPTHISAENYTRAFAVLGGWKTIFMSMIVMLLIATAQTVSSAIVGYGFAKYDFWGKKIFFALLIITFVLPSQTTFLPKYVMFNNMKMLGTIFPFLLPALFGQGIKSAIFILIFYQFFKMMPKSLDESAFIDGASNLKTFISINMPMATPALVVTFVFSFVWNWNETYLADTYFGNKIVTLSLALSRFVTSFAKLYPQAQQDTNPLLKLNQSVIMAGTLITIIPLIIVYIILERRLIESIDKAGITGE